jgi:hypothetical protein
VRLAHQQDPHGLGDGFGARRCLWGHRPRLGHLRDKDVGRIAVVAQPAPGGVPKPSGTAGELPIDDPPDQIRFHPVRSPDVLARRRACERMFAAFHLFQLGLQVPPFAFAEPGAFTGLAVRPK